MAGSRRGHGGAWSLAEGLLEEAAGGPPEEPPGPPEEPPEDPRRAPRLLDQLIHDLNEINEVPFFDVQLPYELALKIFRYLGRADLGRCAQVSRTWKVLSEDEVLWYRLCQQEGYLPETGISDRSRWKLAFQDSQAKERTLRSNWKNRSGAVSQLQYETGGVLGDVHSCEGVVIAGYTSGDVRLWDTRAWDFPAPILDPGPDPAQPGPQAQVSLVRINPSLAVAAYEDGTVSVWSLLVGREPVHRYQHNQKIRALALSPDGPAIATASGLEVRVEYPNDNGYWQRTAQFDVQKLVNFLHLLAASGQCPVAVAAAEDAVYVLRAGEAGRVLHWVYGQPVTCLDVSASQAAFGVKSSGWINEGNKILLYSLQTGQCLTALGGSLGDFTCLNLRHSPPHLLVAGSRDRRWPPASAPGISLRGGSAKSQTSAPPAQQLARRMIRVRVLDVRSRSPLSSLYAHPLGVSAVQMDDWKVVSGGEEGLVCVWDRRTGTKLWEMHARHPVRHVWFNAHSLITANVPDEKTPRGASLTDDDLTAHRRHRGIIQAYEFSAERPAQESVLPICRSSYDEVTGYNYNIGLAVPYDNI
ncbi:F-box/WD repeat-containing protein 8 [Tachyglossus aculeatus]|uniref:F-box/WD repeat-containing protein 8 n=1 Tax=Tachyglossus aculeatus TaxID=9261 RepID=UPI0018F33D48|nr:F-box/WD repeat-containing protein 8 [Tachyglossus aculeatus]